MILSIIAVLVVFGVIVIVHEWGHMMAARLCGIAVPDFALGMGPSVVKWTPRRRRQKVAVAAGAAASETTSADDYLVGETTYHICAFPIGGFVRIAGLEGDDALDGRRFPVHATWKAKNGWQKAFVLLAGPIMNFLLAFLLIMILGFVGFPRTEVLIADIATHSPASEAGIQRMDRLEAVDGRTVHSAQQVRALISANGGKAPLELVVERDGQLITLSATPRVLENLGTTDPSLGIVMNPIQRGTNQVSLVQPKTRAYEAGLRRGDIVMAVNGTPVETARQIYQSLPLDATTAAPAELQALALTVQRGDEQIVVNIPSGADALSFGALFKSDLEKLSFGETMTRGVNEAVTMFVGTVLGMQMMFSRPDAMEQISGPAGIVSLISQSAQSDWHTFLLIVIMINISIGLFNLFPFPALDGGRLVFVALAGIGVRLSEKREALVHTLGMIMLLGLILFITIGDIRAIFLR